MTTLARGEVSPQLVAERATASANELMPADGGSMFERLLRDPLVDVDKLERLMAMHERAQERGAKAEYYADFAKMQGELPTVLERGMTNNGAYARHEDIIEAVRDVLKTYGFIITFRTEFPDAGTVKVIGVLAHRSGHAEQTEFLSKPDTSGNKNAIQAVGSAISYGQRYTMRSLLNIASTKDDDDGRKAHQKQEKPAPEGYDKWLTELQDVAAEANWPAYGKFWNDSPKACRAYLVDTAPTLANKLQLQAKGAAK